MLQTKKKKCLNSNSTSSQYPNNDKSKHMLKSASSKTKRMQEGERKTRKEERKRKELYKRSSNIHRTAIKGRLNPKNCQIFPRQLQASQRRDNNIPPVQAVVLTMMRVTLNMHPIESTAHGIVTDRKCGLC